MSRLGFLRLIGCIITLLLAFPALANRDLPAVMPKSACPELISFDLKAIGGEGSKVTEASEMTSDGIPVCSVTGLLAPHINFQVLLPTKTWCQRHLQVGCGGLCGRITLRSGASSGCQVLNDGGFVMAATDMGHAGMSAEWGLDDGLRADYPWPATAVYSGSGNEFDARNWTQGADARIVLLRDWAGADLFSSFKPEH